MIIRNITSIITAGLSLLFATCVQAASVSYILDQSDRFDDDVDYISVTISDDAEEGMLSVTVNMLPALRSLLGDNAGIEAFSFNLGDGVLPGHGGPGLWGEHMHGEWCGRIDHIGGDHKYGDDNAGHEGDKHDDGHDDHKGYDGHHYGDALKRRDFGLPDDWYARFNRGGGKSSMYDVTVFGRDAQDTLQFLIAGLSIEDILDEFAVRVTGLLVDCEVSEHKDKCYGKDMSAYFYGGRLVVPLPASVWLLGSGMLGLLAVARRKRS
ncbi:MAG: VPLPA-CTERM sorting domain-containing protein [Gammaproteobacteria bacterium]|nr:VPLPA-CTERM sorting domain-containing protein [Gammaproteobacteria bacterium]